MTEDVRTGNWRLFSPELDDKGVAYARLVQIGSKSATDALAGLADLLQTMDSRQPGGLRLTAAALVLRDLISLGWQTLASGGWLYVRPGPPGLPSKDAARRQLQFGRDDQLSEPSIRKFILTLERPGRGSALRPVTDLIADGRALETDLKVAASLEGAERHQALVRACRPYLQPVSADARDEHTGIRLMDVWRYFRHTWATRYRSSPGRNLFYLIRDGARPFHPVIGITALGNAVMQLGPRDDAIGWTVEGLRRALSDGRVTDAGVLAAFKAPIKEDYLEVFRADLPVPMQLSGSVAGEVLDRLSVIEKQSTDDRAGRLRELDEDDAVTARVHDVQGVDLEKLAKTPLFRAKRARTVRTLLSIYAVLASARSVGELLASETGTRAVNNALRQLKKRFSATSMMEITVCGAVPPYNHLLGGKLACLLMLSPRVRRDYSERYSDAYSIIASQMAGRPVSKPPMLTFLGTSSLYPGRSSQYNRVRLPEGTCEGQESRAEYVELGVSEGYGSPNLSAETESALEALAETERSYRNVNFVFGEGQSPKLRQLREGFAALGLNRSNVLNHGTRRIVYGIDLAENSTRLLLGVDGAPRFRISDTEAAEEQIVDFWRTRWLSNRLRHGPALVAVSASSPLKERVSKLIPERATKVKPDLIKIAQRGGGRPMASVVEEEKLAFIRQLYRDESAYSDHVKIGRLRELNIRTHVDDVVRRVIRAGGSVVITGNAGDGKTHTIRLLESELKAANARYITDASAVTQDEIVTKWIEAREQSAPFCIAINEGPLIELIRRQSEKAPWLAEVHQQLLNTVNYVPVDQNVDQRFVPQPGGTVVIDLSLRRTLARDLVERIIDKLTEDVWYEGCVSCPHVATCPVHVNRTTLERNPLMLHRTLRRRSSWCTRLG